MCHCTRTRSPSSTFHDALCMTPARSVSVLRAPIITPNKNTFDSFVFRHATAYRCSRCACSAAIHIASSPARLSCTRDICTTGQAVRYYTGHTSLSSVHVCRASRPREGGAGSRREPCARGADREQTGSRQGSRQGGGCSHRRRQKQSVVLAPVYTRICARSWLVQRTARSAHMSASNTTLRLSV